VLARQAFEDALATGSSGVPLEGMSAAAYVLLELPRAIDEMERAHAAYRSAGDGAGAVRTADVGLAEQHAAALDAWLTGGTPYDEAMSA
jgi:hypothetical protein